MHLYAIIRLSKYWVIYDPTAVVGCTLHKQLNLTLHYLYGLKLNVIYRHIGANVLYILLFPQFCQVNVFLFFRKDSNFQESNKRDLGMKSQYSQAKKYIVCCIKENCTVNHYLMIAWEVSFCICLHAIKLMDMQF